MRRAGLEGDAQRLAGTQQVFLADDVIERARPQFLGERSDGFRRVAPPAEEIGPPDLSPPNFNPLARPPLWAG